MDPLSSLGVIPRKPLSRRVFDVAERALNIRVFRAASAPTWPEAEFARVLFRHLQPDCVFDVGANIGQYGSSLRNIQGFSGQILSFEPNPEAFETLAEVSASDPDWHCFPYALGREPSSLRLNVTRSHNFASLKPVGHVARARFGAEVEVVDTPTVEVRTLEREFAKLQRRYGFRKPFLKMDTQGYDLEVVIGAANTIDRFCGLLSEVSVNPMYENVPAMEQSLAEYRNRGFSPVGLFDVQANGLVRELLECNCYCARTDLIA